MDTDMDTKPRASAVSVGTTWLMRFGNGIPKSKHSPALSLYLAVSRCIHSTCTLGEVTFLCIWLAVFGSYLARIWQNRTTVKAHGALDFESTLAFLVPVGARWF